MASTVSIHDVRVGMFIHLDLGWMRHPFPLSSFRISSDEQLQTLRGLGLDRVRWVPEKSLLDDVRASEPFEPAPNPAGVDSAAVVRHDALAEQRAGQRLLERQYAEASSALGHTIRIAREQPRRAREDAQALSRALIDKLLVTGEPCIRMLCSGSGDRAASHGANVAVMSLLVGRGLGLAEDALLDLGVGALLHDLGKQGLASAVRHVEPGMSATHLGQYRQHVERGVALGRAMGLAPAALAVLAEHHEHADGSGFPRQARGEQIALGARIVALVDGYDTLCNPPTLATAMTPHEAMALLFTQRRERYDGDILTRFIRLMGVYPAGSIVQLTDERYAMVISVDAARPLRPRVLVHDPRVARDEALYLDLRTLPELGIRRSLPAARLPTPALDYLAPQPRLAYFFDTLAPTPALEAA